MQCNIDHSHKEIERCQIIASLQYQQCKITVYNWRLFHMISYTICSQVNALIRKKMLACFNPKNNLISIATKTVYIINMQLKAC